MTHLLVTNDFPPKVGGIQSYLYELWRRLDPQRFVVLTTPYEGAARFDAAQAFPIVRSNQPVLLPTPGLVRQVNELARTLDVDLVVLDPLLPLGLIGPHLERPYGVVLHGAEVTVPVHLPVSKTLAARVLSRAELLIAAGGYPAREARRVLGAVTPDLALVPPGVDIARFHPIDAPARRRAREASGVRADSLFVLSVSRLVPRKGMDVLIEAAAALATDYPDLVVAIGGAGRDRGRLMKLIERLGAPVKLLGRVSDEDLPQLTAAADIWAMLCRNRWGGLEQEGFGIVFLEAAACGVAQIAGNSGGAGEAVLDGRTGIVCDRPGDVVVVTNALRRLLADEALRLDLGTAARERAVAEFDHDVLAETLSAALARHGG
jgi:phosphatidylinositol alpha-1,6-mannosyltransferase